MVPIVNRPIASFRRFVPPAGAAAPAPAPAGAVARFRADEGGSLTIFGLVMFVMMMVAGASRST